jgi:hypothetical protein
MQNSLKITTFAVELKIYEFFNKMPFPTIFFRAPKESCG